MRSYLMSSLTALALILALAVGVSPAATGYANPQLLMETDQLEHRLQDPTIRLVDVRSLEAYQKGHIVSAVHLDAEMIIDPKSHIKGELLPQETLAVMLGERGIGKNTEVILYDAKGGFLAARVFWLLEYFGHQRVRLLNGGFPKWQNEGRQVTTAIPTVPTTYFPIDVTPRRKAMAGWILQRETDPKLVVIDVRPAKMYHEGHIPWARNIPWKQNLTAEETLKPARELVAHFEGHDVTKDKNVVVHCQVGKAAAHSYFTLRLLGYPRIRSYDRSWAEWGAANDLPKATGPAKREG